MYFIQFLCLQNLSTPSETEDSVAAFVKTERFSPCLGHGMCKLKKILKKTFSSSVLVKDTSDFIGCYPQTSGNYLADKKTQNNLMHIQLCIDYCHKENFSLAALSGIA